MRPVAVQANRRRRLLIGTAVGFRVSCVLTREVPMPTVLLLVAVLPLLTALIVVAGRGAAVRNRIKIAVWPLGAAFCGAVAALYVVTTQGPITARFYEPDLAGSFPVPLGFYVDRLSAVMLVLISAI